MRQQTKEFYIVVFIAVVIYLKWTEDKSQKHCDYLRDDPSKDIDDMTSKELIGYIYQSNSSSCRIIHDFGGVMSRVFNGLSEMTPYHTIDGQKSICMDSNFTPRVNNCIVYSIGISFEWTFDEAIAQLGCHVYAFDPSMDVEDHDHTPQIHFYKIGIGAMDTEDDGIYGWKLMTLQSMYRMLRVHHGDVPIDYLKIDIEFAEWDVIPEIIRSGMMRKVKQLGVEIHFDDDQPMSTIRHRLKILKSLEDAGMVRFASRPNINTDGVLQHRDSFLAFELAWYNSRFAN